MSQFNICCRLDFVHNILLHRHPRSHCTVATLHIMYIVRNRITMSAELALKLNINFVCMRNFNLVDAMLNSMSSKAILESCKVLM